MAYTKFVRVQNDPVTGGARPAKSEEGFVRFTDVCKYYHMGDNVIKAANGVNFSINEGEFCVIVGPSGAGKTTVLNMLGGMDSVTSGEILVDGVRVSDFKERQLTEYRRYDVGFVFQFYNLIQNLTALENVEIAVEICKDALDPRTILTQVGLGERLGNFPSQLSGGEQQRVSIARALAKNPKLLLCDEPTGALDYVTGKIILKLLHDVSKQQKKPVIIVTHNAALKDMADKVIHIKSGRIEWIEVNKHPTPIEEIEW